MSVDWQIERLGEDALLLRFGDGIDAAVNARVHAVAASLARDRPPWLIDIVPAYATLAVCVDPNAFADASGPLAEAERWLRTRSSACAGDEETAVESRVHVVRVRYGGGDGPDLEEVSAHANLSPAQAIARHTAAEYRVAMLGFAAGFPYLLGMDPQLAMPRRATPRTRVASGSVGIGGAQTGIYPKAGPGGWRIVGRTDAVLFDASRDPPALFAPGDRVRFVAVNDDGSPR